MKITVDMIMTSLPNVDERATVIELWAGRELSPAYVATLPIATRILRRVLGDIVDLRDLNRSVARRIVRDVLGDKAISKSYQAWLSTGNAALRQKANLEANDSAVAAYRAASAADYHGASAAISAAAAAASEQGDTAATAYYAAYAVDEGLCSSDTASKKYVRWMAEFLEGEENEKE